MPGAVVRVTGAKEMTAALRALSSELPAQLRSVGLEAAAVVAADAKTRVPVLSGALQSTIRAGATQRRAVVRAGNARVPYAGPIHFGWPAHNIAPHPFLYDAAEQRAANVALTYQRAIQNLINSVGLGAR